MQIQNIPETYEELERYNLAYEHQNFRYSDTNCRVGEATRDLFLSWFPSWMRSFIKPGIYALLDETMLDAFGFAHASPLLRSAMVSLLKIRARLIRLFPPRNHPSFHLDSSIPSYPTGYEIANVGPPENVKRQSSD
ncbi:hypothetical protein [Nostoc sp.]|uniref:hypothetical protein n=1 Tax=Nostoc sp. TaxID=1180 RepID=UPI002FF9AAB2